MFDKLNFCIGASMLDYSTVFIKGSEGLGKSAFLAHWVVTVVNGDEEMGKGIFTHFVGCTPESLRGHNILQRIIAHYSKVLGISVFDIIPDYLQDDGIFGYWTHNRIRPGSSPVESLDAISRLETEAVLSCLNDFMLVAARKAKEKGIKIIIVVDGIENLETDLETYVLRHLGLLIPEIRVILSFGGKVNGQDSYERFMSEFRSTQIALRTCENKEVAFQVRRTQRYFPKHELHEEADVVCLDLCTVPTVSKEQHQRAMVDLLVQYGRKIDEPKTAVLLAAIKPSGPLEYNQQNG